MITQPFQSMKGFSDLFCDLLQSAPYISSRFPALDDTFENRMQAQALRCDRKELVLLLHSSLSHLSLTEKQQHNLHLAALSNTTVVVTGQQVGFLGGPLYTLYKAYSAIAQAEKLQAQYQSFNVIPLFWIEDNDHDRNEAAEAYILDKQGMPQQIICPADTTLPVQTPVSELSITDDISAVLTALEQHLPENEYTRDLMPLLHTIYTVGTEWSVAFMRLLQHWCGEKGLLFVRASDIRKSGAFASIVKQELAHPLRTLETVHKVNNELRHNGYTPQVEPSAVNLFYHDGTIRKKINYESSRFHAGEKIWTQDEIIQEAKESPELFSPNVLLRPLCQDALLPTCMYVAGPGECAYLAQIKECYSLFDIEMPVIHARHSATLLFSQHQRLLDKAQKSPLFFMRKYHEIEQDIAHDMSDKDLELLYQQAQQDLEQVLAPIMHYAESTDQSLTGATAAARKTIHDSIDTLKKKITASKKRQEQTSFDRAKTLSNFLYPNGAAQERTYSPIALLTKVSWQTFHETLTSLTALSNQSHYIITFTH